MESEVLKSCSARFTYCTHTVLVLGSNEWAIYDAVRVCDHIWSAVFYSNVRAENVATLNHLSSRLLVIVVGIGGEVLLLRGCSVGDVLQDTRLFMVCPGNRCLRSAC